MGWTKVGYSDPTLVSNTRNSVLELQVCYIKYKKYVGVNLSQDYKVGNMYISHMKDLTLDEFVKARQIHCDLHGHASNCYCKSLINAAREIINAGICQLALLYKKYFNQFQYKSDKAVRQFMQLPVAIFPVKSKLFIAEYSNGLDYNKLANLIESLVPKSKCGSISKVEMKLLCSLASSEKDRKLIKVAASSGLSASQSKAKLGIEDVATERDAVFAAVKELQSIREAVEELAVCKQNVFTEALQMSKLDSDSDSDSDGTSSLEDIESQETTSLADIPSAERLLILLKSNKCNWVSFASECHLKFRDMEESACDNMLDDFIRSIESLYLSENEKQTLEQSREAYAALQSEKVGKTQDDEFYTDSESDNPEDWIQIATTESSSEELKKQITKQQAIVSRWKRRRISKIVASRCLLRRKLPPRVSKTLAKYPNIGKDIERFARENRIGADSWRRTGLLTFSGNVRKGPKLTYNRIRTYLQDKYNTKFSYGTIVQLCCARNKRRLSAKRYWGTASIVSRRARKGFNVKLNVDAHWSCSFYKNLDFVQLKNGLDKVVLNRDDAAGFRLDTTFTHKQKTVLAEKGNPELTTRTDYLNKYSSVLQTSSYMFLETDNTPLGCFGAVKPHGIFSKNPSQHAADLEMFEVNSTSQPFLSNKIIDCIRVDGGVDEGPSHVEVQFQWTERHVNKGKVCTMVTSRFSGGSYLNKVELQNGCLSVGHSNLFIPSTIHGSNKDAMGQIDKEKQKKNLEAATDVYISAVDGSSCCGTKIHLTKGATGLTANSYQERRENLLIFLRGTKKQKAVFARENPDQYKYFKMIWEVRNRHMVPDMPENYVFMLLPCFRESCPHKVCAQGQQQWTWYDGGPYLSVLPLPVPDSQRPWGGSCKTCLGSCTGHYLPAEKVVDYVQKNRLQSCSKPPSAVIKTSLKQNPDPTEDDIQILAKECLLNVSDTHYLVEHHRTIEKRKELKKAMKAKKSQKPPDSGESGKQE